MSLEHEQRGDVKCARQVHINPWCRRIDLPHVYKSLDVSSAVQLYSCLTDLMYDTVNYCKLGTF